MIPGSRTDTLELKPPGGGDDSEVNHWTHFAEVMEGKAESDPSGYDGRMVVSIMRAAEISQEEGRFIKCSEAD